MRSLKFRVLLDTPDDVFRDVEVSEDTTFFDLHNTIVQSFGFAGGEMASFYVSNEDWDKGREVPLMDMGMDEAAFDMTTVKIAELVEEPEQRFVYVYDFLRMWCFYIELVEEGKAKKGETYPKIVLEYGEAPAEDSKEIADIREDNFKSEKSEDGEDGFGDIFDMGGELGSIEDIEGIDEFY